MVSLTFSDVTKRFGGRTVIEGLSATLAGGTVTAVTGGERQRQVDAPEDGGEALAAGRGENRGPGR